MSSRPNAPAPMVPGVELLEVIGSGGSGVVYRGRQTAFGREVAVKVASAGADAEDEAIARWEREVAAIGRLSNHPNIVPVFDAGITPGGAPYLVMPYVPRGTLGDRLRDEGPMEADEVAAIGAKLAATLATVHGAGVLHRDVKPDNVLWSPHGEPQLSDFGIARLQDLTTTVAGNLHATIAYAAPEVLAGRAATEASDVYGLGATLYACLTGSAPHPVGTGEHVAALVAKVLETDPPALTSFGVPAGLAAVVERAMARRPEDRYADAAGFRDALAQVGADGGPIAVPDTQVLPATAPDATRVEPVVAPVPAPSPEVEPRPRPARTGPPPAPPRDRSNWTLWLAVLAVLVVAGGLVVLASMNDDEGGTATEDTVADATTEPADATTTAPAETTEPPATEPPTTEPPAESTTTEATTTTAATDAAPAASSGDAAETAITYIDTLDGGDFDAAWAMTTSRFQSQQDRDSWEAFWGGYDIEIVGDPRVDEGSGTVIVPLTFDGQREDYRLDMVEDDGAWLIDGPVGN